MQFDEYWAKTWQKTGQPAVFDAAMRELAEKAWNTASEVTKDACADACEAIAFKHQQTEGSYAAGKKAGALECAEALRSSR